MKSPSLSPCGESLELVKNLLSNFSDCSKIGGKKSGFLGDFSVFFSGTFSANFPKRNSRRLIRRSGLGLVGVKVIRAGDFIGSGSVDCKNGFSDSSLKPKNGFSDSSLKPKNGFSGSSSGKLDIRMESAKVPPLISVLGVSGSVYSIGL